MKHLCNLSYEERRRLYRNVEDFFVVAKNYPTFKNLHRDLLKTFGNRYKQELWCIITGTLKALKYTNTRFKIPRTKQSYSNYNNCTKQKISYLRMKELIQKMEDKGYMELYVGYWFDDDDCMSSFLDLKPQWVEMFPAHLCKLCGISRHLDIVDVVRTDYTYTNGEKKKVKTPVETRGIRGVKQKRTDLIAYNVVINDSNICINNQKVTNIIYKRKFELDLNGHGRFYTIGGFQSEESRLRRTITINGNRTCEIDIKACQPSILFCWAGIEIPEDYDPYKITTEFDCNQEELRNFCKVALLCILFNNSKRSASAAMVSKLRKDKEKQGNQKSPDFPSLHKIPNLCKIILEELLEANKLISQFFFHHNLWSRLQNCDASICEYVINHFTKKGIPVLSVHDSWVIQVQYEEELKEVIREGWIAVVGDDKNLRLDVKMGTFFSKRVYRF